MSVIGMVGIRTEGDSFTPPGPGNFDLPGFFEVAGQPVTKPMVQLVIAAVLVFWLFHAAIKRRELVPGRFQFAAEGAYGMVRNSVARDIIGSHDFMKYVPYLVTLFFCTRNTFRGQGSDRMSASVRRKQGSIRKVAGTDATESERQTELFK